jgi:D-amino-acid dehydrogenase
VTVVERNAEQRDGCSFRTRASSFSSHFVPLAAPGMVALGLKWMWNPDRRSASSRASWALIDWAIKFWKAANVEHVRRAAPVLRDLTAQARLLCGSRGIGRRLRLTESGTLMLCRTQHAWTRRRGRPSMRVNWTSRRKCSTRTRPPRWIRGARME